jgi:hypothetical protein
MRQTTKSRIKRTCAILGIMFVFAGWSWGFYMATILYGQTRYTQGLRGGIKYCQSQEASIIPLEQASYGYWKIE